MDKVGYFNDKFLAIELYSKSKLKYRKAATFYHDKFYKPDSEFYNTIEIEEIKIGYFDKENIYLNLIISKENKITIVTNETDLEINTDITSTENTINLLHKILINLQYKTMISFNSIYCLHLLASYVYKNFSVYDFLIEMGEIEDNTGKLVYDILTDYIENLNYFCLKQHVMSIQPDLFDYSTEVICSYLHLEEYKANSIIVNLFMCLQNLRFGQISSDIKDLIILLNPSEDNQIEYRGKMISGKFNSTFLRHYNGEQIFTDDGFYKYQDEYYRCNYTFTYLSIKCYKCGNSYCCNIVSAKCPNCMVDDNAIDQLKKQLDMIVPDYSATYKTPEIKDALKSANRLNSKRNFCYEPEVKKIGRSNCVAKNIIDFYIENKMYEIYSLKIGSVKL